MASTKELIQTLKLELRTQHITYAQIAQQLDLSEASIKRLFSTKDMSLSRLECICQLAGLDILQLATKAVDNRQHMDCLVWEHEQEIVSDMKLLILTIHLMYGWEYKKIIGFFEIDPLHGQRLLTRLDTMKVIELLPHNQVRILLSAHFNWLKNGPIQTFFEDEIQTRFFQSGFDGEGEMRLVSNGWMSLDSIIDFHTKLMRLSKEFELQLDHDKHIPIEKRKGTTLVVAIRPWTLDIFKAYRKER